MAAKDITLNIFYGFLLGIIVGVFLNFFENNSKEMIINFLDFGGSIFLKTLKMMVVPVVFVSLICGVCNLENLKSLGRIGIKSLSL